MYDCSTKDIIFGTKIKKDAWDDVLESEERRKEMLKDICENRITRI